MERMLTQAREISDYEKWKEVKWTW